PTPVRKLRPEVPEAMAAVLARMMAKDAAARYQTPAEVATALAPWTRSPPPPPTVDMPSPRRTVTAGRPWRKHLPAAVASGRAALPTAVAVPAAAPPPPTVFAKAVTPNLELPPAPP